MRYPGRIRLQRTSVWQSANRAVGPASNASWSGRAKNQRDCWLFIHYLSGDQVASDVNPAVEPIASSELERLQRLEAVLFLSPQGISSRKMAKLAGLADATEARTLIRRLNEELDRDRRSFRVEEVAGGYGFVTRPHFAPWLRRMVHIPGELRLSQTSLETLAIVAYRQPVLRADIEAIRGVGCSEILRQLMEMDLVRISGRSEDLGRPYLYGTTKRFLQMFGLRSADRLPRMQWVNESQLSMVSGNDSATKESAVNMSLSATATLEKLEGDAQYETIESPEQAIDGGILAPQAIDDDDDDWIDDDDDDVIDDDDEEDDDFDDESWDDDEDEDEDEDDDDDDDESNEWQEVDDDDDGWESDDDEEDEDDDDDDDDDWDDDDDEDWD